MNINPTSNDNPFTRGAKLVLGALLMFGLTVSAGGLLGWCNGVRPSPDTPGVRSDYIKEAGDPAWDDQQVRDKTGELLEDLNVDEGTSATKGEQ